MNRDWRELRVLEATGGWVVEAYRNAGWEQRYVVKNVEELLDLVEQWVWEGGEFDVRPSE